MFDDSLIKLSRDKKKHEFFVVTKAKIVIHLQSVVKIKSEVEKRDRKKKTWSRSLLLKTMTTLFENAEDEKITTKMKSESEYSYYLKKSMLIFE